MSVTPEIRNAEEEDLEAVRDLFVAAYGPNYPFREFYDTHWLKRSVFDEDTLFLVALCEGRIAGTASAMFTAGDLSDLLGEFGRLVVHPDFRGSDVATVLCNDLLGRVERAIRFGFAEARTAHPGSQKILERSGFVPVGFEPLKYRVVGRESVVLYGRMFGPPGELRRNHPRLIPEIAPLAAHALRAMGIEPDVVVVDEETGYPRGPFAAGQRVEELSEQGWSPLLRIERGRVRGREVFGNLSLSHGFFKIKSDSTRYLVASRDSVTGGLGLTHDPVDGHVRIFELIGFDDTVKGRLLAEAERLAREELGAVYLDIDVSAYAPAIQRTLERMGFAAVAYCPSMVFEGVERLDVVRMAKLVMPYFREDIPLTGPAGRVRDLVEQGLADRRLGCRVADAARATRLFRGLDEGDIYHLARIGRVLHFPAGERLIRQGAAGDRFYLAIGGTMRALVNGTEVGRIPAGETAGELALIDAGLRSADVVAEGEVEAVEILCDDFHALIDRRPRIGSVVMRNLAVILGDRLRRANLDLADNGR